MRSKWKHKIIDRNVMVFFLNKNTNRKRNIAKVLLGSTYYMPCLARLNFVIHNGLKMVSLNKNKLVFEQKLGGYVLYKKPAIYKKKRR